MGKRRSDNVNNQPFDSNATPEQKAKDFDRQYGQNRQYSNAPTADAVGFPKAKGKHRK